MSCVLRNPVSVKLSVKQDIIFKCFWYKFFADYKFTLLVFLCINTAQFLLGLCCFLFQNHLRAIFLLLFWPLKKTQDCPTQKKFLVCLLFLSLAAKVIRIECNSLAKFFLLLNSLGLLISRRMLNSLYSCILKGLLRSAWLSLQSFYIENCFGKNEKKEGFRKNKKILRKILRKH